MIIPSLCNTCLQPYQILVEAHEVPLLKQIATDDGEACPCPRLCGGMISLVRDPVLTTMAEDKRLKTPMAITGVQLYQAVSGLGLPDEVPKDERTVESLLLANKVEKVDIEVQNEKLYLHEIHLSNGTVLHLGAGLKGAQILRVSKGAPNAE